MRKLQSHPGKKGENMESLNATGYGILAAMAVIGGILWWKVINGKT